MFGEYYMKIFTPYTRVIWCNKSILGEYIDPILSDKLLSISECLETNKIKQRERKYEIQIPDYLIGEYPTNDSGRLVMFFEKYIDKIIEYNRELIAPDLDFDDLFEV